MNIKGFSRSNKLVRHMRIHTGVRPYKCTHCDRAFTQSNDLTLHIRRHTGEKPYVCGVCGDRFIQGTALQTHRRMQGHYEGLYEPAPFANMSVNNPNRFTNANRVNRIGLPPPPPLPAVPEIIQPTPSTSSSIVTTINKSEVIRRPSIENLSNSNSSIIITPNMSAASVSTIKSPQHDDDLSHTSQTSQHEPAQIVSNMNIPPGATYIPNGVPYLSNSGVLMQNLEVSSTLFQLSSYNPNNYN